MAINVTITATLTDKALFRELLQHVRDFDARHMQDIAFTIGADCPEITTAEMESILASIKPPFAFHLKLPITKGH